MVMEVSGYRRNAALLDLLLEHGANCNLTQQVSIGTVFTLIVIICLNEEGVVVEGFRH